MSLMETLCGATWPLIGTPFPGGGGEWIKDEWGSVGLWAPPIQGPRLT